MVAVAISGFAAGASLTHEPPRVLVQQGYTASLFLVLHCQLFNSEVTAYGRSVDRSTVVNHVHNIELDREAGFGCDKKNFQGPSESEAS